MQLNRENGSITCCQEPDWLCSNPSSAISSCVNWDKLFSLFILGLLHLENDVRNSSASCGCYECWIYNLFIKHLEPCLALVNVLCQLWLFVLFMLSVHIKWHVWKENKWNLAPLLGGNGLSRRDWFGTVATGYWDLEDMVENQGATSRLGRQCLRKDPSM